MELFVCEFISSRGMIGVEFVSAENAQQALDLFNDTVDQDDDYDVRVFRLPKVSKTGPRTHRGRREILASQTGREYMDEDEDEDDEEAA